MCKQNELKRKKETINKENLKYKHAFMAWTNSMNKHLI